MIDDVTNAAARTDEVMRSTVSSAMSSQANSRILNHHHRPGHGQRRDNDAPDEQHRQHGLIALGRPRRQQ